MKIKILLALGALVLFLFVLEKPEEGLAFESENVPLSAIYAMGDWRNCDYWNTLGMGSQYAEVWSKISTKNNLGNTNSLNQDYSSFYDWSWFDNYLSWAEEKGKPVILTIQLFVQGGDRFINHTPNWLKGLGTQVAVSISGRPECGSINVPNYLDQRYQTALKNTIYQFGRRYNNDSRVAGIFIAGGLDDETRSMKKYQGCDYYQAIQPQIPDREYNEFVKRVIDWYVEAFPKKTVFIQPAAATLVNRRGIIEHAVLRGVGIKMNGLTAGDSDGGYSARTMEDNKYHFIGFADWWQGQVPVAFEPKTSLNIPEKRSREKVKAGRVAFKAKTGLSKKPDPNGNKQRESGYFSSKKDL